MIGSLLKTLKLQQYLICTYAKFVVHLNRSKGYPAFIARTRFPNFKFAVPLMGRLIYDLVRLELQY